MTQVSREPRSRTVFGAVPIEGALRHFAGRLVFDETKQTYRLDGVPVTVSELIRLLEASTGVVRRS